MSFTTIKLFHKIVIGSTTIFALEDNEFELSDVQLSHAKPCPLCKRRQKTGVLIYNKRSETELFVCRICDTNLLEAYSFIRQDCKEKNP